MNSCDKNDKLISVKELLVINPEFLANSQANYRSMKPTSKGGFQAHNMHLNPVQRLTNTDAQRIIFQTAYFVQKQLKSLTRKVFAALSTWPFTDSKRKKINLAIDDLDDLKEPHLIIRSSREVPK